MNRNFPGEKDGEGAERISKKREQICEAKQCHHVSRKCVLKICLEHLGEWWFHFLRWGGEEGMGGSGESSFLALTN